MADNPTIDPAVLDSDEKTDSKADPKRYRDRKQPHGTDPKPTENDDDLGDARTDFNIA